MHSFPSKTVLSLAWQLVPLTIYSILAMQIPAVSSINNNTYYITNSGECTNCGYHGETFQWCNIGHSVVPCSTKPGRTSLDKKCRHDHECGLHGEDYLWCYLENGEWDTCSLIEDSNVTYFTNEGKECAGYCDLGMNDNAGQYLCNSEGSFRPCSPFEDVTTKGFPCRNDHSDPQSFCGKHNGKDFRCSYTNQSRWDEGMCSIPIQGDGYYSGNPVRRAHPEDEPCLEYIYRSTTRHNSKHCSEVTFTAFSEGCGPDLKKPESKEYIEALGLLNVWRRSEYQLEWTGEPRELMQRGYPPVSLNWKGTFKNREQQFLNLRIQSASRSIGSLHIQFGMAGYINWAYLRLAYSGLVISLKQNKSVWIYQNIISRGRHKC